MTTIEQNMGRISTYGASERLGAPSQGIGNSGFSVDDFFKLFAAQLQNQDMMNPVDDTQFMMQMAQITTLQVMQQMNELTTTSFAFDFFGKNVVVADFDKEGNLKTVEGVVEKVTLYNGKPEIYVDGKAYDLSQVMEVVKPGLTEKPDGGEEKPGSSEEDGATYIA